jgi:hypothetical protein
MVLENHYVEYLRQFICKWTIFRSYVTFPGGICFILWLLMWQAQIIGCGSHGPFSSMVYLWKIVIFQGKLWDYQRMLLKMSKFTTFHINSKLFHLMVIFHGYPTIIQYCTNFSPGLATSWALVNCNPELPWTTYLCIYICIITIYIWIYLNCLYAQTYCYNYTLYIIIYIIIIYI